MTFRQAAREDIPAILALYRQQIGTPGCTWDSDYPGEENLSEDLRLCAAFVLEEDGVILAAASAGFEPELSDTGIAWKPLQKPCELARICSARHGEGLAFRLLSWVMEEMERRGFDGFRLLVSPGNPAALALYQKLGFTPCDTTEQFGHHWLCYQK